MTRLAIIALCLGFVILTSPAISQEAGEFDRARTFALLGTGVTVFDYTIGIKALGTVQVNVGLERVGERLLWVPLYIDPTLGLETLVQWIRFR